MPRFLSSALLMLALTLAPAAARAQSEPVLDETQRAAIQDYFKKKTEDAAAAEKAQKAKAAKAGDNKNPKKPQSKPPAKKKVEKPKKPKKPEKPKSAKADKNKDKSKTAKNGKNGKGDDKAHPTPAAANVQLERGQVLAPDLPRRALPKDLDAKLGKTARGTQRVIVGDDVVLFERKTGKILDVYADIAKTR